MRLVTPCKLPSDVCMSGAGSPLTSAAALACSRLRCCQMREPPRNKHFTCTLPILHRDRQAACTTDKILMFGQQAFQLHEMLHVRTFSSVCMGNSAALHIWEPNIIPTHPHHAPVAQRFKGALKQGAPAAARTLLGGRPTPRAGSAARSSAPCGISSRCAAPARPRSPQQSLRTCAYRVKYILHVAQ